MNYNLKIILESRKDQRKKTTNNSIYLFQVKTFLMTLLKGIDSGELEREEEGTVNSIRNQSTPNSIQQNTPFVTLFIIYTQLQIY